LVDRNKEGLPMRKTLTTIAMLGLAILVVACKSGGHY
jgi:hypothetical protein